MKKNIIVNVKKHLQEVIIENINNIREVNNPIPDETKAKIRHDYKMILKGVATGTNEGYDKIEAILDNHYIGSHDLKQLLETTGSAMELFRHVKSNF